MLKQLKLLKRLKIKRNELVLEIGSGSNPFIRSDVLIDKFPYVINKHRSNASEINTFNKYFIVGDAEELPFKENAFDWIICRHVLEHLNNPTKFFNEIKRVSKKAFIITPSPFTELVHGGYQNKADISKFLIKELHHGKGTEGHKWFVLSDKKNIYMLSKSKEYYPIYLFLGFFVKHKTKFDKTKFFKKNPSWRENIFISHNLNENNLFKMDDLENTEKNKEKTDTAEIIQTLSNSYIKTINKYKLFYHNLFKTKKEFNLNNKLVCPVCKSSLSKDKNKYICTKHGNYPIINNVPVLIKEVLNK